MDQIDSAQAMGNGYHHGNPLSTVSDDTTVPLGGSADFARLLGPVVRELLGEPQEKRRGGQEWRYGTHGSLKVEIDQGVWHDHEANIGGGTLKLLEHRAGLDKPAALDWLRERKLIEDRNRPTVRPRIVATYDYASADGELLFQVVRYEPKSFVQRRPDGKGGWIWKRDGVELVPYRLPELLSAGFLDIIFVVEGEKDVEALRRLNLVATCNPGGAAEAGKRSKWPAYFAPHFKDREVVVLPDNDAAGRAHAEAVARNLYGTASRVTVVELPGLAPKGDVSDWIAGGGDIPTLLGLVKGAQPFEPSIGNQPEPAAQLQEVSAKSKDSEAWSEPLDFLADADATGAPELRPAHIPAAIAPFVFDTAERMGVDPAAVALSALVALASVMHDDWQVQPKQHDDTWTESPRLWGAIVGDPSILKTPVLKATTRPIDAMEAAARERHADAMRRYKVALKAWKDDGSPADTEPKPPRLDRYMVEGTTIEALSEALRDDFEAKQNAPAGKILVRQDEMSEWVASFDRYSAGGRGGADRGAYLRLFNGGRYTVDRVNRGSFAVPNWSACVLGGIQPGPIQKIARDAADDGLLQRFCYCVPAKQGRGQDRKPQEGATKRYEALFPALAVLHPQKYLSGEPRPVVLHAAAHQHRLDTLDLAEAVASMPDTSSRLKAALGKWPGLFARLSLIFHLIEAADANAQGLPEGPMLAMLPEASARMAAGYMREVLLPHLLRAEAVMFATEQTGHASWIAGFILSKGQSRLAMRDLIQAYRPLRAPEKRRELLEVVASLEAIGWLRAEPQSNPTRPPAAWSVNPKVHTGFAVRAERERTAREETKKRIAETLGRLNGRAGR